MRRVVADAKRHLPTNHRAGSLDAVCPQPLIVSFQAIPDKAIFREGTNTESTSDFVNQLSDRRNGRVLDLTAGLAIGQIGCHQ